MPQATAGSRYSFSKLMYQHSVRLHPREESAGWWAAAGAMVVVTASTMAGNAAVMAALWRAKRAPSHYPLASLVLADLLVGFAVQPIAAARELFVFNLNRKICAFWSTMDVLCCTASILSLCALGWERWSGITAPLARLRRARTSRLLVFVVWPVATLVALPSAFVPSPRHFHPGELEKACAVNINTWYVLFSVTLSFYLPAAAMAVLYGCILRALSAPPPLRAHRGRTPCRSPQNGLPEKGVQTFTTQLSVKYNLGKPGSSKVECTMTSTPKCSDHEAFIQRQRRAARIIVMLMALFLVCWTPYFIILPLDSLFDCVWERAWQWSTWLGYANSALNPLVYAAVLRPGAARRAAGSGHDRPRSPRPKH